MRIRTVNLAFFAAIAAFAVSAPAVAATPTMGAVEWSVYKHPEHGCPSNVQVFVSSYATGWADGDAIPHDVTYMVERIKTNGSTIKYKPLPGRYLPLTMQNGKATTELASFDTGEAVGFKMTHDFTNKFKLIILKPFHWESEWNAISPTCIP